MKFPCIIFFMESNISIIMWKGYVKKVFIFNSKSFCWENTTAKITR